MSKFIMKQKNKSISRLFISLSLIALFTLLFTSCEQQREVVVYCTVDQVFSEPILKDFEKEMGIKVKAVYDTEETKSTGVLNRLIAEKNNPQCDVFWSGDPLRNNILKENGITASYHSTATEQIPDYFCEKDNHWIGFSARARVLIYNKKLISADSLPQGVLDFVLPKYKGKFAIANPLFGTTTFHIAAIYGLLGDSISKAWLNGLKANDVVIATSNGDVKKRVMNGQLAFGLTDTDDAFEAKKESDDVDYIFLDQQEGGLGSLIIPNAVSAIAKSPNSAEAKLLIDYLLSVQTEAELAISCAQMPLIKGVETPDDVPSLDQIKPMKVDYDHITTKLEAIQGWLKRWVEEN
jgi:iron(III) transport system substrate-binding protein